MCEFSTPWDAEKFVEEITLALTLAIKADSYTLQQKHFAEADHITEGLKEHLSRFTMKL